MIHDDKDQPGYTLDPCLLLQYLIHKSEELSEFHRFKRAVFPLPYRGLGAAALGPFPELQKQFSELTSRSEESVTERARKCKKVFEEALARPEDMEFMDHGDAGDKTHPFDRVLTNRLCWAARLEGEQMLEQRDFRFLKVWECMVWIALHKDSEKFNDFQEKCRLYSDPTERLEAVIPILRAAMTRREPRDPQQAN